MNEEQKPKLVTEKKIVKIDDVTENPYNPNRMPDALYQKMKAVIQEKGLFGSIYVRPFAGCYQILDGAHRMRACKELGWKEIPVECSVVEITDQETKFWTIYFNNTRGKDDIEARSKLFSEITAGQSSLLPFTKAEIENEKALFKFDFSKYDKKNELPERTISRNFIVPLTEDEYIVVSKLMQEIKESYNQEPIQWLMEKVKQDLDLFLGSNVETDTGVKEI